MMTVPNYWLLLGGDYVAPGVAVADGDVVIAVDGGMRHARELGVVPQWWLGDFDSSDAALRAAYSAVPRLAFPTDKSLTDLELALQFVAAEGRGGLLHIIGSSGGEADHAFANLWVLPQSPLPALLWQGDATVVAGNGALDVRFCAPVAAKVSLFALSALSGINSEGLRWPLRQEALHPFVGRAARNEMAQECAQISWQSGSGLVFLPPTAHAIRLTY